jgi:hypothetical protein
MQANIPSSVNSVSSVVDRQIAGSAFVKDLHCVSVDVAVGTFVRQDDGSVAGREFKLAQRMERLGIARIRALVNSEANWCQARSLNRA